MEEGESMSIVNGDSRGGHGSLGSQAKLSEV